MKKVTMTILGVAFMGIMALAQVDTAENQNNSIDINESQRQDPTLNQSTNPQYLDSVQRTQNPNSPIVQPLPQQQPQPQSETQPQLQSQPQLQTEPRIQTQPQQVEPTTPTGGQPILDRSTPTQQDQLNQPVQPAQPAQPSITIPSRDPGGTTPPR